MYKIVRTCNFYFNTICTFLYILYYEYVQPSIYLYFLFYIFLQSLWFWICQVRIIWIGRKFCWFNTRVLNNLEHTVVFYITCNVIKCDIAREFSLISFLTVFVTLSYVLYTLRLLWSRVCQNENIFVNGKKFHCFSTRVYIGGNIWLDSEMFRLIFICRYCAILEM